jgi:hypothetical protein
MDHGEMRPQTLPLRLDIPHAHSPIAAPTDNNAPPIPSFTFTSFDQMMMDTTPVSAASTLSFFGGDNSVTTQIAGSPISSGPSDADFDPILDPDPDFEQLRLKLQMMSPSPDVHRALQRGNKLLKAGSALLPKTNLESMDVSRQQNQEALTHYRSVLSQFGMGADPTAIADSLRHISQIQANSSLPDLEPEVSLADRERLLAGFHFLFGQDSPIYLRQVLDFCDKGRSADSNTLGTQVSMFKKAVEKMLQLRYQLDRTESILHTANTYYLKSLMSMDELEYLFARIISHQAPQVWWKDSENIRFVARVFLARKLYSKAEPYLLAIMRVAYSQMLQGDFFEQDQYACFLFDTLSNHVWSGENTEYMTALLNLETGLRNRKDPSQFDCLELTCWILLATAYTNGLQTPDNILAMLQEAALDTREDRPNQVSWHFIDGVTSALQSLSKTLRDIGYEDYAVFVQDLAYSVASRWALPKLYAG